MFDFTWPIFCELPECTDPSLSAHHHHIIMDLPLKIMEIDACTCGDIEEPGTRPKDG